MDAYIRKAMATQSAAQTGCGSFTAVRHPVRRFCASKALDDEEVPRPDRQLVVSPEVYQLRSVVDITMETGDRERFKDPRRNCQPYGTNV